MKLVVGLGNPGKKYEKTRHNVGYMVIDSLLKKRLPKNIIVKKTNVLMNESGKLLKKLVNQYKTKTSDLWVIYDDLDIALGKYKISKTKAPKKHKGLLSIYDALKSKDFWHVRVGIDNREVGSKILGERYVLQDFTEEEFEVLQKTINNLVEELTHQWY